MPDGNELLAVNPEERVKLATLELLLRVFQGYGALPDPPETVERQRCERRPGGTLTEMLFDPFDEVNAVEKNTMYGSTEGLRMVTLQPHPRGIIARAASPRPRRPAGSTL